jgi:sugar phosphate isomerase/epimerase
VKLCISEATTLPYSFAEDLQAYAGAGCGAMEVWLTKLETHLERHSVADTRRLVEDRQMTLAAAAFQGGLLLSQGEERKAQFDSLRRRLDLCQQLGIPTLIVAADFVSHEDANTFGRAIVSLKQAAQWAAGFNVKLALEFSSATRLCASLDTAIALITETRESNVGINFDVFHYYTGPSKFEDFDLVTAENLAHVQLCDLSGVPRELATDADRVMPGDGDLKLQPIIQRLRDIGYAGWVSLELLNPVLWKSKANQVAELGIASLERVLR